ncbi:MAG: MFS transporter [Acidimicrobiia bacterium]|nr:MFS transporter [Acidimicrobiia bacterium]
MPDSAVRPPDDPPAPSLGELLADRSVLALVVSRLCSAASSVAMALAMGKLVYDITGRELSLGLVGLAEFLPTALLVIVAGALADRVDRRRISAVAYLGQAGVAAVIAGYVRTAPSSVGVLLILTLVYGAARGFANPASRSLPPSVAPPGGLARLVSTMSTVFQLAAVTGPIVAGILYAVDPALPFVVIAVLHVLAAAAMAFVRLRVKLVRSVERPTLSSALDGLRLVRRTPILLGAIGLDLFAVLFGGAVALAPALAEERLGVGAVELGWMRAAGGVGAAATALLLMFRPLTRQVGRYLLGAVAAFGLATIALGTTRNLVVALVLLAAISAADMVSVFVRATIVPLATPDHLRGRVMAVEMVFIGASNELGAFESGVTAEWFGLVPAIIAGGLLTLVVVAVWWVAFPSLRDVDRFSDIEVR